MADNQHSRHLKGIWAIVLIHGLTSNSDLTEAFAVVRGPVATLVATVRLTSSMVRRYGLRRSLTVAS